MLKIPVFPIPECVTFPGTTFPLHVFEPRFRNMVNYCIENDAMLGIAHTQKVVQPAKTDQPLEEALNSNQATYKPYPVFSAGKCELLKTLDDGRMYLNVHLESRFIALAEIQTLPFTICRCDPFSDRPESDAAELSLLKEKILSRLHALTASQPDINAVLRSETWVNKDAIDFSFEVFGLLRFDAEMQQEILEMSSAKERLETLLGLLNN